MESNQGSAENLQATSGQGNENGNDEFDDLLAESSENTLVDHLNLLRPDNPYLEFDTRRDEIRHKIKERFKEAPKTVLDEAEENKPPIEKRLEDTDKVLADLLSFGTEIITNIKVANEKRELLRREFEAHQRMSLEMDLHKESTEAVARYNDIVARWSELGELKEPMIMFEKLEEQKERITQLMRSKDEMIAQCQREIDRMNERFQEDQLKQEADICALVERIDGQIELMKKAYKHHLDLLQDTIDSERQTIALKEREKWTQFYDAMQENEQYKVDTGKQKKQFYATEVQRITGQQEEITRATRIRLERDAEMLEYELRNTKNQVLMNSEKLDYNYQVLQKRNEENVIINNQQKRRVGKLREALSEVKKRIQSTQANADFTITKLTNDIQKLHDSISDLEKKSENFRLSNRKKFFNVWDINFHEVKALIEKVFDIDRILHEQQLGLPWKHPDVDLEEFPLVANEKGLLSKKASVIADYTERGTSFRMSVPETSQGIGGVFSSSKRKNELRKRQADELSQKSDEERKRNDQRIETRLLRNILRKVADRGGFLVEDKLISFLEPYSEEEKTLVRIDNIFAALRITDMQAVNKLVEYFKPYSWCPNCMRGIPPEQLKKLFNTCQQYKDSYSYQSNESINTESKMSYGSEETRITTMSVRHTTQSTDQIQEKSQTVPCDNHYLIVESAMVLTALNEFTNQQTQAIEDAQIRRKTMFAKALPVKKDEQTDSQISLAQIDNEAICQYWRKFMNYMPKEKQKLWHSLEHGLQHYLEVLKRREQLDKDCAFLRRQNAELKHLLQKFQI